MSRISQSYVHGTSQVPLIGETIGVHLDRMAALSPGRDALVVPHQDVRHQGVDDLLSASVGERHPGSGQAGQGTLGLLPERGEVALPKGRQDGERLGSNHVLAELRVDGTLDGARHTRWHRAAPRARDGRVAT
jgi:hypothetical protein